MCQESIEIPWRVGCCGSSPAEHNKHIKPSLSGGMPWHMSRLREHTMQCGSHNSSKTTILPHSLEICVHLAKSSAERLPRMLTRICSPSTSKGSCPAAPFWLLAAESPSILRYGALVILAGLMCFQSRGWASPGYTSTGLDDMYGAGKSYGRCCKGLNGNDSCRTHIVLMQGPLLWHCQRCGLG